MSLLNWFYIILTWYYCYYRSGNGYNSDYDNDSLIDSDYDPRSDQSSDSEIELDPELMATQVFGLQEKKSHSVRMISLITPLLLL